MSGVNELHDLETFEVSLVPKGANGKNFLVFKDLKGKHGMASAKQIIEWLRGNQDPKVIKQVEQVIKDLHAGAGERGEHEEGMLTEKAKAGLQAIARIAGPMKDQVKPEDLIKVLHACGYDMQKAMDVFGNPDGSQHSPDGEPPATLHDSAAPLQKDHMKDIPMDILSDMKDVLKEQGSDLLGGATFPEGMEKSHDDDEDEDLDIDEDADDAEKAIHKHMKMARKAAKAAYKEYLGKLGYRKYPDAQVRFKGVRKEFKQVDVYEENHAHGEAQPMDKNVLKSLDLTKVDPKIKTALEAVFKANQEAVSKAARLEADLKKEREERRDKEFVEKASKIEVGGSTDELAKIMKSLADANPKLAESFETIMKGAAEQIKKGKLFEEMGSRNEGSLPGHDAWAKIEALANGLVEKSAEKITKAEGIDAVLKTAEGKRLYDEYMASKPNMKV